MGSEFNSLVVFLGLILIIKPWLGARIVVVVLAFVLLLMPLTFVSSVCKGQFGESGQDWLIVPIFPALLLLAYALARLQKGAFSIFGTGTKLYGWEAEPEGMVTTKWLCAFFVPFCPVRTYRASLAAPADASASGYARESSYVLFGGEFPGVKDGGWGILMYGRQEYYVRPLSGSTRSEPLLAQPKTEQGT